MRSQPSCFCWTASTTLSHGISVGVCPQGRMHGITEILSDRRVQLTLQLKGVIDFKQLDPESFQRAAMKSFISDGGGWC